MTNMKTPALILMLTLLLTNLFAPHASAAKPGTSTRERARQEQLGRESAKRKKERVTDTQAQRTTVKQEDVNAASNSHLSQISEGRVDTLQLDIARKTEYRVEVGSSTSSKSVAIKISDMIEQLSKNVSELEKQKTESMTPDQAAVHNAKVELGKSSALLLTLASKRYEGSKTELVLARDAFARQVETAIKILSKNSIANVEEVAQHVDVINAIVQAKNQDPSLTDAEATLIGVREAYKKGFEKRCQDGSCKVPSDAVLEAGALGRLKDLKDCI